MEGYTMKSHTTRRAVLAGAAALPALAIIPATAIAAGGVDPIFAAIERHRAVRASFWESNDMPEDVMDLRCKEHHQALAVLLSTRPTTIAGCIAILRHLDHHLAEYEEKHANLFGNRSDPVNSAAAAFLATIAEVLDAAVQS
jgi:hypothetical protein